MKGSTQKNIQITFLVFLVVFICNIAQINHFVMYNSDSFKESEIPC